MTIEETIKSCDEVVTANKRSIDYHKIQGDTEWIDENEEDCIECAEANRQFAKWLRELKAYREAYEKIKKLPIRFNEIQGITRCINIIEDCLGEDEADENKN